MLIEREGQLVEVSPQVCALEESIVRGLRKHGPLRQRDLWFRSSAPRFGREMYLAALDALVGRGVIRRLGTNRVNAFIYRMASDQRKKKFTVAIAGETQE